MSFGSVSARPFHVDHFCQQPNSVPPGHPSCLCISFYRRSRQSIIPELPRDNPRPPAVVQPLASHGLVPRSSSAVVPLSLSSASDGILRAAKDPGAKAADDTDVKRPQSLHGHSLYRLHAPRPPTGHHTHHEFAVDCRHRIRTLTCAVRTLITERRLHRRAVVTSQIPSLDPWLRDSRWSPAVYWVDRGIKLHLVWSNLGRSLGAKKGPDVKGGYQDGQTFHSHGKVRLIMYQLADHCHQGWIRPIVFTRGR
jgi:hypothetical protein